MIPVAASGLLFLLTLRDSERAKINPEHRRPRRSGFWDSTGRERSCLASGLLSSRCATKLHRFRCSFFTTASAKSNSADDQSQCNNVLHDIFPVESFRYRVNLTRPLARKHVAGAAKSRFANWRCCADTVAKVRTSGGCSEHKQRGSGFRCQYELHLARAIRTMLCCCPTPPQNSADSWPSRVIAAGAWHRSVQSDRRWCRRSWRGCKC